MSFNKYRVDSGLEYNIKPGWNSLANAILIQAVADYSIAVGRLICEDYTPSSGDFTKSKCKVYVHDIRKFFKSAYCEVLTGLDGQYLLDLINRKLCKRYGVTKDELPIY